MSTVPTGPGSPAVTNPADGTATNPNEGPAIDVVPLREQFTNHDEFKPPTTDALAGRRLLLSLAGGGAISVHFESGDRLSWSADRALPWGSEGSDPYEAMQVRDGIFTVVAGRPQERESAMVVLDLEQSRAIANLTRFAGEGDGVREQTTFAQAGIDGPLRTPFERTLELVGKRVHHRYSSTHAFEHIYLNGSTYCFHGLQGPEAGVADVDRTDTFKLGDALYLFSWHERSQPFNGAVVIDLALGRTSGRFVGWERDERQVLQIRTGATSTLLNETRYPAS